MVITCYTMSQPCCLHMASRFVTTPHGHSGEHLPHDHKPRSLPNVHGHRRLIPSVCWNCWCLWCRKIHAQRRQTLQEAEAAGNTLDVDVEELLLGESAGGNSLSNGPLVAVPFPDFPLSDIPLRDVPLSHVRLPNVPLSGVCPDGSVGEEWSSQCSPEEACVWVRVEFLCCEFSLL